MCIVLNQAADLEHAQEIKLEDGKETEKPIEGLQRGDNRYGQTSHGATKDL